MPIFQENDVYTILQPLTFWKYYRGYKYVRLKYWDGYFWIVRFLREFEVDWIALTETKISSLITNKMLKKAKPEEELEAVIWERKYGTPRPSEESIDKIV